MNEVADGGGVPPEGTAITTGEYDPFGEFDVSEDLIDGGKLAVEYAFTGDNGFIPYKKASAENSVPTGNEFAPIQDDASADKVTAGEKTPNGGLEYDSLVI